jgi:pSer/pThr/pTyr-binding forkhead associated (FHA) protein
MSSQVSLELKFQSDGEDTAVKLADKLLIGRNPGCAIVLAESSVSGKHAAVVSKGDRWFLADLDSSNGIVVDGKKVKQLQLLPGARFRIGGTSFQVAEVSSANEKKTSRSPAKSPSASAGGRSAASRGAGGDLVIQRTSLDKVESGGSIALQTLVFIGILGMLFYSSFDLLSNLASDPNAMEVDGDLFSGSGAFESASSLEALASRPQGAELLIESGEGASQGMSWLEVIGEPAADGSLRLLWDEQFSVPAGQGVRVSAAMKSVGFDRFGLVVRWTETSDADSAVISEDFTVVRPRSGWSRIALESPAAISDGFASATVSVIGLSDRGNRGSFSVDQWVAKIVEMERPSEVLLESQSDQQRVSLLLDDRGVGQVIKGRLEMISDLRMSLGAPGQGSRWGQILPLRKEPFVVGEDESYRLGFELNESGESAVIQQFVRAQNQRIDMSWTLQRAVPASLVFRIKSKRLSRKLSGFSGGMSVSSGLKEGQLEFTGDEFALGEGNQQVVLSLSRPALWSGVLTEQGDLVVSVDHGVIEAGGLLDLAISASSAREQENLDRVIQQLSLMIDERRFGEASMALSSAREQMGWRDDLESRLSVFSDRISAEVGAVQAQLEAVQEDIRRYPGSPAEGFLVEICEDAQKRFKGLAIEAQAGRILQEIQGQSSLEKTESEKNRVQTILALAREATENSRGELARFYYRHVIETSPGTPAAAEAEQGIKIVEAKGI